MFFDVPERKQFSPEQISALDAKLERWNDLFSRHRGTLEQACREWLAGIDGKEPDTWDLIALGNYVTGGFLSGSHDLLWMFGRRAWVLMSVAVEMDREKSA